MDRMRRHIAINFDLKIDLLKIYYSEKHPKRAYREIKEYMKQNGFIHRQHSGYLSVDDFTGTEIVYFMNKMYKEFPWLYSASTVIDVTEVGRIFDAKKIHEESFGVSKPEMKLDIHQETQSVNQRIKEIKEQQSMHDINMKTDVNRNNGRER